MWMYIIYKQICYICKRGLTNLFIYIRSSSRWILITCIKSPWKGESESHKYYLVHWVEGCKSKYEGRVSIGDICQWYASLLVKGISSSRMEQDPLLRKAVTRFGARKNGWYLIATLVPKFREKTILKRVQALNKFIMVKAGRTIFFSFKESLLYLWGGICAWEENSNGNDLLRDS